MKYRCADEFLEVIKKRDPDQVEFHQAVEEVINSIWPFIESNSKYQSLALLERIVEPERVIIFRVPWVDDSGEVQVHRGYRVQMSSAIGPYKGGIRFHPRVNLSILKFLAFEQVFKNSLTTLPMGGGKGGSDFDPKNRSDLEVMRFCQSFMTELYRHIGSHLDIPAGDINVGGREIGFLFGQYKRLSNEFTSTFTGKELPYGGSLIRPEATGYGCMYFVNEMLLIRDRNLSGMRIAISGSGNVAQFAAKKAIQLGAYVISFSDSSGTIISTNADEGFTAEQIDALCNIKNARRGRVHELVDLFPYAVTFHSGERPWKVVAKTTHLHPVACCLPCACENELDEEDAAALIHQGLFIIAEGANMPCTATAINLFLANKILFAPGKASNAGGVAVSGLEMSQNAMRLLWSEDEVDIRLKGIMKAIHLSCMEFGAVGHDGQLLFKTHTPSQPISGADLTRNAAQAMSACTNSSRIVNSANNILIPSNSVTSLSYCDNLPNDSSYPNLLSSANCNVDFLPTVITRSRPEQWLFEGKIEYVDYVRGANIAGFVKVADAMISQGIV